VIGRDGRKNDLVVMTCNVANVGSGAH
jgi:hypothetical protein